jgi:hypothetical protein
MFLTPVAPSKVSHEANRQLEGKKPNAAKTTQRGTWRWFLLAGAV